MIGVTSDCTCATWAAARGVAHLLEIVMADKRCNSAGLQLADLVARPTGRKVLNREQPNRAFDILADKFRRSRHGRIEGWGLKVFP